MSNAINWYIGLFTSKDDKVVLAAISTTVAVTTFIINFVLKKIFKNDLISNLVKYFFQSLFKLWYLTLLIIFLSIILNYITNFRYLHGFLSIRFVGFNFLLFIFLAFIFPIIINTRKKLAPINIAFYGSFLLKNNEKITLEVSSDRLNQKIADTLNEIVKNSYVFSKNLITLYNIQYHKIIPITLGYRILNKRIQNKVKRQKHLSTIHFIEDREKAKLHTVINYNQELLINSDPLIKAKRTIESVTNYREINNLQQIELIINLFLLQFSQIYIDQLLDDENYSVVHFILDDTDRIIREISNKIDELEPLHQNEINQLTSFWQSNSDRYRAITLLEQKEYLGSVNYIFNAIDLNPYYPYQNYEELKLDYIKKYGIELLESSTEFAEILEVNEEFKVYNDNLKIELTKQIKYPDSTWHFIIVQEIMRRSDSPETISLIEKKLTLMSINDPFQLMTKYEILKFLKKGEIMVNQIYNDRIPECIEILKSILSKDPNFYLAISKWGTLLFMKGIHFNNQQMIEEGIEKIKEGKYVLTQLGFKMD